MRRNTSLRVTLLIGFVLLGSTQLATAACTGRFPNPITDVCWKCVFPLRIGGVTVASYGMPDTPDSAPPVCACPITVPPYIRIGIGVSFWEPARASSVVREPFCEPLLGGVTLASPGGMVKAGGTNTKPNGRGFDFYQVHWMVYPLTNWLTMLANASCLTPESFDIFMLSEFEITWNDDEASSLFHPEVFLFTSVPAQAACATDCVAASAGFPLDFLFWCSGCNGSTYPWSGSVSSGQSGIQSSVLVSQRMHSKLHRTFVALDYGSTASMCYPIPMPIIPKSHYKTQMIYPIPETQFANPYGRTTAMWGAGRNFPVSGEDFSYVIFRKRVCCAF